MSDLFCRLAVAYIIGEFLIDGKGLGKAPCSSKARLVHQLVIAAMMAAFSFNYIVNSSGSILVIGILVIAVIHFVIDCTKANHRTYGVGTFVVGQTALFALMGIVALVVTVPLTDICSMLVSAYSNAQVPRYVLGYLAALLGGNAFINAALRAIPRESVCPSEKMDHYLEVNQLLTAGAWLGIIERTLIITLALLDQYTAIGFVFTAKAFARKSWETDSYKGMYFLVGTLMSFLIAILAAVWIKYG
jgi:hypothetical protein